MNRNKASWLIITLLLLFSHVALGIVPERVESKGEKEFGWFVAPTPLILPGVGAAVPVLAMFSNAYETTDLMAMQTLPGGDFDMRLLFLDQLPLFSENVLLQAGNMEGTFPFKSYNRGIDSDADDFSIPVMNYSGNSGNLRVLFWEKRLRFFYNQFNFTSSMEKIYDADGNEFENEDKSKTTFNQREYGIILDMTDNRTDPGKGLRVGIKQTYPENQDENLSDYYVTDFNLTYYLPLFENDTLVFNYFRSSATVTREGLTDESLVRALMSLDCENSSDYDSCQATEDRRIEDYIAANKYGTATSLGGANRLQAYDMNRFTAGHSAYQAIEYRMNLSTVEAPINYYLVGGLKTVLQLAFFAERGTVSDDSSELDTNYKNSFGVGIRTIISNIVYRFDLAMGDEGIKPTLFFFYPMDLQPVGG